MHAFSARSKPLNALHYRKEVTAVTEGPLRVVFRLPSKILVCPVCAGSYQVTAYLKRSEAVVRERITALPGFPQAIRLPVAGSRGRGQPLWKAKEVIAWTEKHHENRIAWSSLAARSPTDGA